MNDNYIDPNKLENGSWSEWRRLVVNELNRLNKESDDLNEKLRVIQIESAKQTTKVTIYATIGGAIVGAIISLAITLL